MSSREPGNIYAVILVGGKGKRLRPLSTDERPKAFLSITKDKKTMFKTTVDRIGKLIPQENILAVANKRHASLVNKDFPDINKRNLLLEPVSRNTAPAIAFAASVLKVRFGDVVILVLPADQYINNERRYLASIKNGIEFVKNNREAIVVFGLKPAFPSTGFGYIRVKGPSSALRALKGRQGSRSEGVYKAEEFVEKPDLQTAKRFLKSGRYLWNTGAFVFTARTILNQMRKFSPRIAAGFEDLNTVDKVYTRLPDISIDYAVMEKTDNLYCVEGSYGWEDVGSFECLKKVLKRESRDFVTRGGRIIKIL